ncbi:diaminohydroxyphosphoribosylaminopyrimidine deaminase [Moraxella cuniculi DSM 21768]|uniref:Riboflavin biosynthesis protein RibD n=1 Tax=Moraxella cuniculi DSM 21768 TaxID=1122245 RepID=A0A1N7DVK4_9GAMM|nr:bifunctional diaminohydroxyphosphoribosylaminopyrimidine deaminase/5-amino-6-(5-phosphoribosylamino)uracil reductase RibD [Moraxella cuniculi]OOS07404.1 riboflavin biosynthesis protein RibD [Moraxella cuniculi]SIR79839.1 diaminohydroxyphosphoribosylaminopyrimidine deaminase [Moraxella cuniculi DSM 21768]
MNTAIMQADDAHYMTLAIKQAWQGIYTTRPNPAVGCVIVKDGMVVGQGFHPKAGQPHAEVFALQDAYNKGCDVVGATAYVTLEPCSHTGRTPPCADALIEAKIGRVAIANVDPNPQVAGSGIAKLQAAGITVDVGVCSDEAAELNRGFFKAMQWQMPYVRLKVAASLDGRTAMASGESKWITGEQAREDVQKLRARSAAIITGSGTVIADNPALSVRSQLLGVDVAQIPTPKIVVIDRSQKLSIGDDFQVLRDDNTLLWRQDILTLLKTLVQKYQCYDVLVEAGARLSAAFIQQNLVDELIVYQSPCILGSSARAMFDFNIDNLSERQQFWLQSVNHIGRDLHLIYRR